MSIPYAHFVIMSAEALASGDHLVPGANVVDSPSLCIPRRRWQIVVSCDAAAEFTVAWRMSAAGLWALAAPSITFVAPGTDTFFLEGHFPQLRLEWSGNTGRVSAEGIVVTSGKGGF